MTRLNMDQQSSKRSNAHKPQVKSKPKKLYILDFLTDYEKDYVKPEAKKQTRAEIKNEMFIIDLH